MTEVEWMTCTDFLAMLIFLRGEVKAVMNEFGAMPGLHCNAGYLAEGEAERTSKRKLRLFAAAISRKWTLIPHDELSRTLLRAYEEFANDEGTWEQFWEAGLAVQTAVQRGERTTISHLALMWQDTPCGLSRLGLDLAWAIAEFTAKESVAMTSKAATEDDWFNWSFCGGPPDPLWQSTRKAIEAEYPVVLREVVGNPFRPVSAASGWLHWRERTIPKLAQAIYDQRAFDRLPVLADALDEAGCTNADILTHCRGPGPHVKGCWVVDLLLGKE